MKNKALLVLLVGLVILASFSIFMVNERELAIKFQLGRIVRSDFTPGLYFNVPFVQNVEKFDKRIQNLDSDPQLYLTSEKKNVKVDSFVKWRIQDVNRFFTATGGNIRTATERLSTIVRRLLRDEFGKRTVQQVVAGQRAEIMDILANSAKNQAEGLGIGIVDVRIKRIDLPEEVSNSVFQRMAAERKEVAKRFRSRGQESATIIRAGADRERTIILAEAERDAQRTRGEGDGSAAEIYADAFNQGPEFYALYRRLNAYKATFVSPSDVLLLQPDSDFFKYFNDSQGGQ